MNRIKNQHGEFETEKENGRPTSWKPEYNDMIIEFFEVEATKEIEIITTGKNDYEKIEYKEVPNTMPTFQRFAHNIGVSVDTLHEWKKPENRGKYPGFSEAYKRAKQLQEDFWVENGMKGLHNAAFAIFWAKNNLGYKDKTEVDQTVRQAPALEIDLND